MLLRSSTVHVKDLSHNCDHCAAMASVAFSSHHVLIAPEHIYLRQVQPFNLQVLSGFLRVKACRQWRNRSLGCISRGRRQIATPCASIEESGQSFNPSFCKCCSRRSLLTSLGSILIAALKSDNISQAAEGSLLSADAIREAVHPARAGWYEELFATFMNTSMGSYEAEVNLKIVPKAEFHWAASLSYKRQLFSRLHDNVKTVVELGVGTGPNLTYYVGRPSINNVIGVDPNLKMARYAEGAAVAAGLSPAQFKFVHAVGEGLPLPSASVDAVICTLVLCSVSDVSSTLTEVQRVLRPGGMFLFVEHVAAPEGDNLRFWQGLLDPVQQFVADGCHLNRDTLSFIEAAHFASVDAERITLNVASLIGPHVVGSACVA